MPVSFSTMKSMRICSPWSPASLARMAPRNVTQMKRKRQASSDQLSPELNTLRRMTFMMTRTVMTVPKRISATLINFMMPSLSFFNALILRLSPFFQLIQMRGRFVHPSPSFPPLFQSAASSRALTAARSHQTAVCPLISTAHLRPSRRRKTREMDSSATLEEI